MNLNTAKQKIFKAKSILISGHMNPDGDSVGSMLALGLGLEQLGKNVFMISADGIPRPYMFLPGASYVKTKIEKQNIDLAISVDCGSVELLGNSKKYFKKAKYIIEIDHHEFRTPFGNLAIIEKEAAAVGEIIFKFLYKLNIKITPQIAQNILTSIIVETNSFRLNNVRPYTFEICAKLMKAGINYYKLAEMVYWSKAKEAALLTGLALSKCQFIKRGKIVYSIIRKKDFGSIKAKKEDVDAVAGDMLSIKGVRIAVFFREAANNVLRVSLRSKGPINIASIANYYGGGGHFDVAGCHIPNKNSKINELLKLTQELLLASRNHDGK